MYQISELLKYPKLFHAFSTKEDGNMANAILGEILDFDKVLENRERFLSKIDVPFESCICMWVSGKDGIEVADPNDAGMSMRNLKKAVRTDALITNKKGLYLFLLTADCAPVILYDPVKEVIGLIHVGWKGADLKIVKKVIKRLRDFYKTNPKNLIVGIGPAARKDSFIKENPSQKNDPKWQPFLENIGDNKYKVDFVGLCKKQLVGVGVNIENIFDCCIDTGKDNRFFSHVREGKFPLSQQGRFACVVGMKI